MAVRIIARLFFLVAPLLLAACPSARAQPPNCAGLSVALHRLKKPVAMGQFVTIKARLRSFSATFPGRVVVQVSLPPGLCPAKTGVSPDPAKVAPSAATPEEALSAAGDSLFWIDVPVSPHRGGKKTRRFTIKAYASSSMTLGPHSVNASVYVLPSEGGGFVPRCLTQATSRTLTITAAAAASWKKAAAAAAYNCTWTPSPPSPSPAPANPGFEFYAVSAWHFVGEGAAGRPITPTATDTATRARICIIRTTPAAWRPSSRRFVGSASCARAAPSPRRTNATITAPWRMGWFRPTTSSSTVISTATTVSSRDFVVCGNAVADLISQVLWHCDRLLLPDMPPDLRSPDQGKAVFGPPVCILLQCSHSRASFHRSTWRR